jgi:hypothetical protein
MLPWSSSIADRNVFGTRARATWEASFARTLSGSIGRTRPFPLSRAYTGDARTRAAKHELGDLDNKVRLFQERDEQLPRPAVEAGGGDGG